MIGHPWIVTKLARKSAMKQNPIHDNMNIYEFPQQKVLCNKKPYSHKLLNSLLEIVYTVEPPFTGYLNIAGDESSLLFLFFFNGAPYAAGRFADSKPVCYSIKELGAQVAKSAKESLTFTLCETDPVLLKNMLLFLQEEPAVKAPTSVLDFEYVVRQIGEVGANAMIALCRDNKINFFFFRNGVAALAHYSDSTPERSEGLTLNEEMLLYAFQPGNKVQAFIFRDMITTMAEDSNELDREALYNLLTIGYPKNRRKGGPAPSALYPKNRRRGDADLSQMPVMEGIEDLGKEKLKLPSAILSVESGPLLGERFTVTLPCTIGRKNCDVILDDRLISRRHAELKMVDNELVLEDLASKNGTRVNGELATRKLLVPNDLVSIGPINLRISPA
jgi:hypothetical protein